MPDDTARRLLEWAQNEEMIDGHYTQHGKDCLAAIDRPQIEQAAYERGVRELAAWLDSPQSVEVRDGVIVPSPSSFVRAAERFLRERKVG